MNIKLEVYPGNAIQHVAEQAKQLATICQNTYEFVFNDVVCVVDKDSNLTNLLRYYFDANLMGWTTIGPDYLDCYPTDVLAEYDKRKQAEATRQIRVEIVA